MTTGLKWKLVDGTGICAQTSDGMHGWEFSGNSQNLSLGQILTMPYNGWISPAMSGTNKCGIRSFYPWKDTTRCHAYKTSGTVDVYYAN